MLPGESFDMLDERFHKILNDLASLNHILSPKEKNVRLLRSLPTEWYTKATAMEEGRNLENYTVQGLLDELRTYEHELKKKKEEQVTPFPTALMTTPRVPSSEGTCTRNCDTPSSSQPSSSKMENYDEEFAMMVKHAIPEVQEVLQEGRLNQKAIQGKATACPYPKVEKYGERERNEKKKKAMVAAESDESSSSSSDEEALVCMERRAEKSNHEDRWTMSEDDTLCLMAKDDADQEVTSQTSCASSYENIPISENLFDQFKKMMEDFEEINLKHSSLTEENKLLSEENLELTEGRKSQLDEITQLKAENESLSEKVKSLNKELGILKSKEAVNKLLETTKHKGREGLGFDPSSSKRKGRITFIPPKPTAKPNKQKGKEMEKPIEVPKKVVPPKNYRKLDRPQKGNNFRRKPSNPHYTRGYTHYGVDRSFPRNSEWRAMPRYSHPPPQKMFVPPKYVYNHHRTHYAQPRQNYRSYQPRFARREQEIAPPARRKFYAYNYDYNPDKFRAARKIPCNFKLDKAAKYLGVWYLDSGCSRHMMGDASLLSNLIPYDGPRVTFGRSNDFGLTKGLGNLVYKGLTIQAVSYVEGLNYNLLSISQFCDKGYSLEFCKDMASLKNISTNEVILTGKRIRNIYEVMWDDVVGANVHFQKLEAKCSSPAFYQNYLEMIAAQELSEFLQMEIRLKYEAEVLEFFKNGEVKTAHSKKDPQRTFQVIKSTVGGRKVKLSQKNLGERLHLPNSGVEVGRFPVKNLDWNIIGISGQAPSGQAKKADLNNDYKLVLELIIACLECGSGGHADDITQERAFIINALITQSKVNWAAHFFKSISKHLGKPNQKYLCQGLYIGHILESMGAASKGKKYEERYWLYYLSSKGENRAGASATAEESSSDNVPLINLTKTAKRKQKLYYDWRAWKVGNSAEQLLDWDQQLKNEKIIKKCLGIPVNHSYPAIYKPVFAKTTEDQVVLTSEAQANLEATAEDFQIFPETSSAFETVLPEAAVSTPQEQNQGASDEELHQHLQSQALEILTTACEISNQPELEIPEKSGKNLDQSTFPETNEEEQAVEAQRSSAEAEKETQMAELEAYKSPVAIFEEQNEAEERDSLSRYISNCALDEAEGESESTLKVADEEDVQEDAESLPMQLFQRTPSSHQTKKVQGLIESALASQHASFRKEIEQMEARHNKLIEKSEERHSSDLKEISKSVHKTLEIISLLSNTVSNTMETYASDSYLQLKDVNKIKEQIANITVSLQKQMSLLQMDIRSALAVSSANQMEVVLQQHSPSLIPELPIAVKEGEVSYIPTHLNMTDLILKAQRKNPEDSTQHPSSSGLDGTEAVGTIAAHFSNDNQT
ncbi:unnamed protein product [Cuscuta campestris]|uniref:Retrovirus-related Pol polyprotein from transposon TNT 1-94-like beta-barrel domain-containing protein n=1 Tax=Cuscuta campestris TaxID=132261 RepID=A0A484MZW1_9ASTE|nr:unnamed protein product [Cuscuta campestris]